jgi:hypothetical protein
MSITIERIENGFVVYTPRYHYSQPINYQVNATEVGVYREYFPTLELAMDHVTSHFRRWKLEGQTEGVSP